MELKDIAKGLIQLLEKNNYAPSTIRVYQREWHKLEEFLEAEYGNDEFDMDRGMHYLENKYGIISKHRNGTLTQQRVQLIRMIQILEDYRLYGVLTRRIHASKNPIQLDEYYESVYSSYLQYLNSTSLSESTKKDYCGCVLTFLDYLSQSGVKEVGDITMETIFSYEKTLAGYTFKTVEQKICAIRHFLRFETNKGSISSDLAENIHMPHISKKARIPAAWDLEEIKAMIKAIDRNSAIGKRDYAMILLACVLGIRSGDIKNLRFSDFHWDTGTLSFVQRKTHVPITLPLPKEVAWAVIDYIKNSRPKCFETDIVFVKHMPPFDPLDEDNHLYRVVQKYSQKAGLDIRKKHHAGFHSLRHSAGSLLLEMGTPLPVITNVLGHSDPNITAIYLKTDVMHLAECVLDPKTLQTEEKEGEKANG